MHINAGEKLFEKHRKHMTRWSMTEVYVQDLKYYLLPPKRGNVSTMVMEQLF